MASAVQLASLALLGLTLAPFFTAVDPSFNCILTACLTVFIGCHRSVKPTPPSETISKERAMRFPLVGSAVLLSLFLLFKFLPKDIINGIVAAYFSVLGLIALSATILPCLENILPNRFKEVCLTVKIPYMGSFQLKISDLISGVPSTGFCVWYVLKKHWFANNVLGIAFSVQGIELLSLGSFKIGSILLVGLFFYDIFWVFCTPVMVSVAKSFDAPIKLLFPIGHSSVRPYSMLGLGDIVIPGIFVALALRFDASRKKGPCYFKSAFAGYAAGLALTIAVMNWFKAAQPALLYIVPGVIGFLGVHCMAKGEIKELLTYDESTSTSVVDRKTSELEDKSTAKTN